MNEVNIHGLPVAKPFDASDVFDVSHHFDAEYKGRTDNPFAGMSTTPSVMMPFQRSDMEHQLDRCITVANRTHWSLSGSDGVGANIDPLTLREPTSAEAKALKLGAEVAKWAHQAAHIRAYLVHLDTEAARIAKKERDEKRARLKHKSQVDPVEANRIKRTMSATKDAARRHQRRIDDERAYHEHAFAKSELEELERKAASAARELEEMR